MKPDWEHLKARRGGTARTARGLRREPLSWGHKREFPDIPSNEPKKSKSRPVLTGDLGELRQIEALAIFPSLRRSTDHVKRASHSIPAPKGWVK